MASNTETRIFEILDEIREKLASVGAVCPVREKQMADIEQRLRDVEAVQNKAVGVVAVVSLFLGSIGAVITWVVKKGLES